MLCTPVKSNPFTESEALNVYEGGMKTNPARVGVTVKGPPGVSPVTT